MTEDPWALPAPVPAPAPSDPFSVPAPGTPTAYDPQAWGGAPTKADPAALRVRYDSIGTRAGISRWLLIVGIPGSAFVAYARFHRGSFVDDFTHATDKLGLLDKANDADNLVRASTILHVLIYLATAAAFISWQRSVDGAARDLAEVPRVSSGWVIGGWFCPFANFVFPYRSISDLSRRLRTGATTGLILTWWLLFIFSAALQFGVGTGNDDDDPFTRLQDLQTTDRVSAVASIVQIVAAVLAVLVVRSVSAGARERLREAGEADGAAAAPSAAG